MTQTNQSYPEAHACDCRAIVIYAGREETEYRCGYTKQLFVHRHGIRKREKAPNNNQRRRFTNQGLEEWE